MSVLEFNGEGADVGVDCVLHHLILLLVFDHSQDFFVLSDAEPDV